MNEQSYTAPSVPAASSITYPGQVPAPCALGLLRVPTPLLEDKNKCGRRKIFSKLNCYSESCVCFSLRGTVNDCNDFGNLWTLTSEACGVLGGVLGGEPAQRHDEPSRW